MLREGDALATRPCPGCRKKKMIKRYEGYGLGRNFPYYWWCGCGNRIDGGVDVAQTEEEMAREHWKTINEIGQ